MHVSCGQIAGFRSRRRLPILSWRSQSASLWRCAQPKSAFTRCHEDEFLICHLLHTNMTHTHTTHTHTSHTHTSHTQTTHTQTNAQCVYILDARPYVNAVASKLAGAGYEDTTECYTNCQVRHVFVCDGVRACVYVRVCVYVRTCVYVRACVYMWTCVYVWYVCMCVYVCVLCVYVSAYACVCAHVCMSLGCRLNFRR